MSEFVTHLLDMLQDWAPVSARRMFSGHGLFRGGLMFALVVDDTLYLKTDAESRDLFEDAGLEPFRYRRGSKLVALGYHTAPAELAEDGEALASWAGAAWEAALRTRPRTRKGGG